jgi:hypothetical protein
MKLAPFPVSLPSSPLADETTIDHVWVQGGRIVGGEFEMAVAYRSGVTVTLISTSPDTEAPYETVALGILAASVPSIAGRSTLAIPENVDGAGNLASAAFVVKGAEIVVYAKLDVTTLESIAASVPN